MKTMANKKTWLGILVMALVFTMMVVGCTGDGGDGTGGSPWIPNEEGPVIYYIGTLSADGKTLTLSYVGNDFSRPFTKNTGGLNGEWFEKDMYSKLTISGNADWVRGWESWESDGTFVDTEKGTLTVSGGFHGTSVGLHGTPTGIRRAIR